MSAKGNIQFCHIRQTEKCGRWGVFWWVFPSGGHSFVDYTGCFSGDRS